MSSFVLAAAFLFLGVVTTWVVAGARGPWQPKLALILAAPFLAYGLWWNSQPQTGWPTQTPPPASAAFIAAAVDEPVFIYLWLQPSGSDRPRAYRLPYSRPLHVEVEAASLRLRAGRRVAFRRVEADRGPASKYVAYDFPPPVLPEK